MSDDILDRIDAAVGCFTCHGYLADDSPSGDFCSAECQTQWHEQRTAPLENYWEPWDRPWDFPGVGGEAYRPRQPNALSVRTPSNHNLPAGWVSVRFSDTGFSLVWEPEEFRLPRQTGNLSADWRALDRARAAAATTPAQRAAVALREEQLNERFRESMAAMARGFSVTFEAAGNAISAMFEQLAANCVVTAAKLRRNLDLDQAPENPRERALQARRARNTGPTRQRRAPRRIDAPRAR